MHYTTYELFKRVQLGDIDVEALLHAKVRETPFIASKIDVILENIKPQSQSFDTTRFKTAFRVQEEARDRLDEIVITNLLFFSNIVKQEKFVRSIHRPGAWEGVQVWEQLLRVLFYCVLTLAYDVRWTSLNFFELDATLRQLEEGRVSALRDFMKSLGISIASSDPYPAELVNETLIYHTTLEFGPYYWRLLHFLAEAFSTRSSDDARLAKSMWRDFVVESLYRTLRCSICMYHFEALANELKPRISSDDDQDFPKLWFDIHNRVNKENYKSVYSESEFEKDSLFMRSALKTGP
jgi:hypothetical protein